MEIKNIYFTQTQLENDENTIQSLKKTKFNNYLQKIILNSKGAALMDL